MTTGPDFHIVRRGEIFITRCSVVNGKVKITTTREPSRAQLFKKPFAESTLEKLTSRWKLLLVENS